MEPTLQAERTLPDLISPAIKSTVVVQPTTASNPRWAWALQRGPVVLVTIAILAGVALRLFCYLRNPSLWIDEAMLALNVVHRSPSQLLQPLDLNQGAPVGYLLLSKAMVAILGNNEYALRLPSLIGSLVGLFVFIPLAYRTLPLIAARIAIALFALAPYLAGYAAEFKQYELDATLAVVLMSLGLPLWQGNGSFRARLSLALAGALAVWFSHPAVFVLGGVGLTLLADAAVRRDRRAFLANSLVIAVWVVSFLTCFVLFTRKLGMNAYLLDYWAGKFMPMPPYTPGHFAWLVNHFFEFLHKPVGLDSPGMGSTGLGMVGFGLAIMMLGRSNWRLLTFLLTPLLLALLASGLQKYPFANRLLMFAVPAALLMVAAGTGTLLEALRPIRGAGVLVVAILFVGPLAECRWLIKKPVHAEQTREALDRIQSEWQPGDRLYVYYGAGPAYAYYQAGKGIPPEAVIMGEENRNRDPRLFQQEMKPLAGQPRVWVLLAHRQTAEETAIYAYLDTMGQRVAEHRYADATVARYDLTLPPGPPDRSLRRPSSTPD